MGFYKYLHFNPEGMQQQTIAWRKEPATVRLERPTRLDAARRLGYRAKPGIIVIRQRVDRGGRMRPQIRAGRRSKHSRRVKVLDQNYRGVAEGRTARKYPNMEVLNSYYVAKDSQHYWYEVILVDKENPAIRSDRQLGWLVNGTHRRRVFRGKTFAARKSRGLRG